MAWGSMLLSRTVEVLEFEDEGERLEVACKHNLLDVDGKVSLSKCCSFVQLRFASALTRLPSTGSQGLAPYVVAADSTGTLMVSIGAIGDSGCVRDRLLVLQGLFPPSGEADMALPVVKSVTTTPDRQSSEASLCWLGFMCSPPNKQNRHPYVIADLTPPQDGMETGTIFRVNDESVTWSQTEIKFPQCNASQSSFGPPDSVVSYAKMMYWINLSDGMLSCDPQKDVPDLVYTKLPTPAGKLLNPQDARSCRCIGRSNHLLRLVELIREGDDLVACMWTLMVAGKFNSGNWRLDLKAKLTEIAENFSYRKSGIPVLVPKLAFVHPVHPTIAFCVLDENLFSVDLNSKKLVTHTTSTEVDPHLNQRVLAWELSADTAEDDIRSQEVKLQYARSLLSLYDLKQEVIMLLSANGHMLHSCDREEALSFMQSVTIIETSLDELNQFTGNDVDTVTSQIRSESSDVTVDDIISTMCVEINKRIRENLPGIITTMGAKATRASIKNDDDLCKLNELLSEVSHLVLPEISPQVGGHAGSLIKCEAIKIICGSMRTSASSCDVKRATQALSAAFAVDEALADLETAHSKEECTEAAALELRERYKSVLEVAMNEISIRLIAEVRDPLPTIIRKLESDMVVNRAECKTDLEVLYVSSISRVPADKGFIERIMTEGSTDGLDPELRKRYRDYQVKQKTTEMTLQAIHSISDMINKPQCAVAKRVDRGPISMLEAGQNLKSALLSLISANGPKMSASHEDRHDLTSSLVRKPERIW